MAVLCPVLLLDKVTLPVGPTTVVVIAAGGGRVADGIDIEESPPSLTVTVDTVVVYTPPKMVVAITLPLVVRVFSVFVVEGLCWDLVTTMILPEVGADTITVTVR